MRNDHIPRQLFYYCVSFFFISFLLFVCVGFPSLTSCGRWWFSATATLPRYQEESRRVTRLCERSFSYFGDSLIYRIAVGFGDYVYRLSPAPLLPRMTSSLSLYGRKSLFLFFFFFFFFFVCPNLPKKRNTKLNGNFFLLLDCPCRDSIIPQLSLSANCQLLLSI